jgi:hypothetical protein
MASAAAMSIYITFTGHVLVLVIISSLYIFFNLFSLSPELDPSRLKLLIAFHSVNLFSSLPHFRLPFLRLLRRPDESGLLAMTKKQWFFCPGQATALFPSANRFANPIVILNGAKNLAPPASTFDLSWQR